MEELTGLTETRVRELLTEQSDFFNEMKEDLDLRSEHTHLEVKGIKGDLTNFNKVNKDFLAAVRDKMVRK